MFLLQLLLVVAGRVKVLDESCQRLGSICYLDEIGIPTSPHYTIACSNSVIGLGTE